MTEDDRSLAGLTDAGLEALLQRAMRITLIIGVLASLILWKASGWRNAAMLATGMAISAASIHEWRRLIRIINMHFDRAHLGGAHLESAEPDQKPAPRGVGVAIVFFMLRLIVFAGAIYGSLKCFRGSVIALLCGLGLAVLAMAWEAVRLLRD